MINETIDYSSILQIPNFDRQVTEISDLEVIRDYCGKYEAFPAYSFYVMFALSLSFFALSVLQRYNPGFKKWILLNKIDLNSYLIMGYEFIVVMNLIMLLIK
jgi:hypothetical protein